MYKQLINHQLKIFSISTLVLAVAAAWLLSSSSRVETATPGSRQNDQDFTWGVLAINPDKNYYHTGETALLDMAVLDDRGIMVCDADLTLEITNPSLGIAKTLSTRDGSIQVSQECNLKEFTLTPDFHAEYTLESAGLYQLTLTAVTQNGSRQISDYIEVNDRVEFDVQRESATRIYPPHEYPVRITVVPSQDFAGTIIETVPAGFDISVKEDGDNIPVEVAESGEAKNIIWQVAWQSGSTYTLEYYYKAPDISPEFYEVGPLQIGNTIAESRRWQIAADAVAFVSVVTGGESTSSTTVTSGTVTAVTDDLYLASITSRPPRAINSVAGLGLTWTLVDSQCGARNQVATNVYMAIGTPSGNGAVTGTFNSAPTTSTIAVTRISGIDTSDPIGAVASSNTLGIDGACTGGTDNATPTLDITTTSNDSLIYGAMARRGTDYTPSTGFTVRSAVEYGTGGNISGLDTFDGPQATAGLVTIGGSTPSATDWAMVAVETNMASAGVTLSGTAYTDQGTTTMGASRTVNLRVNGAGTYTAETDTSGNWSVADVALIAGDVITAYLDGETEKASTVLVSNGGAITDIKLYQNHLIVRDDQDGSLTNNDLYTGDDSDADILYAVSAASGGNLTIDSGITLYIWGSDTFVPGGNILTLGTGGIFLAGNATLTGSGSQTHTSAGTITISTGAVYTAPTTGSVNASHLVLTGTFTAGGTALTLSGTSGTLFTRTGTFTPNSSTINIDSYANVTIFSADTTVNNLVLNPALGAAFTYTLGAAPTINGNFTINPDGNSSGILTVDASGHISVASTGATSITGTSSATSILRLRPASTDYNLTTGTLSISAAGTLNAASAASVITLNGSGTLFSNSGTFTPGSSTVVVSTNGSFSLAAGTTFNNLTINSTLSTSSNLTINGTLTLSGTGNFSPSGGTATFATNGWTIANSGTLAFAGLTISETPSVQPSASFSVSGALTVNSAKTLAPTAGTITVAGGSIVNNGGSATNLVFQALSLNGTTSTASSFQVKGNWTNSGTFAQSAGTVTFNGSGAQQISGTGNTFFGLSITGSRTVTITNGSILDVANNGSLNLQGVDLSNRLTLNSGGSDWYLRLSATNTTQTVTYVSAAYSNAGGYAQIDASDGTSINGGNNTNWNFGSCRWLGGTSIAWETGSNWGGCAGTDGVPAASDDVSIETGSSFSPTLTSTVTVASLTVESDTLTVSTSGIINVTGAIALNGGTLNGGVGTINAGGAWTVGGGSFTPGTGTVTFTNASAAIPALSLNNLTINTSGTATLQGNLTIAGNLSLSSGILNLGAYTANRSASGGTLTIANGTTLIIGGTGTLPSNYSTHSIGATSTIEYAGTSTTVAALNSSQTYANLVISGSSVATSANFTVAVALSVTGSLTASSGTVTLAGATVSNSGTLIFSGISLTGAVTTASSFQVKGTWANSGTFTQSAGTVTFNGTGAQQISGTSNTFFGLAITASSTRTVTITPDSILNIASNGSLSLQGGNASNLLTLQSGVPDWYLRASITNVSQSISYVSVTSSNASSYEEINASNGTNINGGNNTNWLFIAPEGTFEFSGLNMEGLNIN